MGCGDTLILGEGGHVTCSWLECPRPTAADELLHLPTDHFVVFDDNGYTIEHPASERLEGTMHDCYLSRWCNTLDGAPVKPGRYRAYPFESSTSVTGREPRWRFEEVTDG
jgi:hypothetical protein